MKVYDFPIEEKSTFVVFNRKFLSAYASKNFAKRLKFFDAYANMKLEDGLYETKRIYG